MIFIHDTCLDPHLIGESIYIYCLHNNYYNQSNCNYPVHPLLSKVIMILVLADAEVSPLMSNEAVQYMGNIFVNNVAEATVACT